MSNARTLASTINSSSQIVVPSGGIAFNEAYVMGQDGYEEGTFSPGLGSNTYGTFAEKFSQSEQEAYYIKIGSQVTCWIHGKVTIVNALGANQFLYIFNLPFTGKNTTYATSSGSAEVEYVGNSVEFIFLSFPDNSAAVNTGYSLPSTGTGQNFIVEACLTYTV